jgi:hypothetical protein
MGDGVGVGVGVAGVGVVVVSNRTQTTVPMVKLIMPRHASKLPTTRIAMIPGRAIISTRMSVVPLLKRWGRGKNQVLNVSKTASKIFISSSSKILHQGNLAVCLHSHTPDYKWTS